MQPCRICLWYPAYLQIVGESPQCKLQTAHHDEHHDNLADRRFELIGDYTLQTSRTYCPNFHHNKMYGSVTKII